MLFTNAILTTFLRFLNLKNIQNFFVNYMNLKDDNKTFSFEAEDLNTFLFLDVNTVCYFNFLQSHIY